MTTKTKTLAEARADKAKRDAEARAAAEARELEALEVEERLSATGRRGHEFEIVETVDGPIAVTLGEGILHSRFQESKMTDVDLHDYVFPNVVHPSKEAYLEIVGKRPAIALRCASALATLYGAKASAEVGKF